MTETFAVYLARTMLADGYEEGLPPASEPIADDADYALLRTDGMTLEMAVIIDREAHPGARFTQSPEAVRAALTRCLAFCGRMNRTQMPASLAIYEIGTAPPEPEQQARLTLLHTGKRTMPVAGWVIDAAHGTVWCTRPRRMWFRSRALARMLHEPRADEDTMADRFPSASLEGRRPRATLALLALLAAIFVGEVVLAGRSASGLLNVPSPLLFLLGATRGDLVLAGLQPWRTITAAFLHGGLLHIAFNGLALLLVGTLLERIVGQLWFVAVFFVGAVGGSVVSALINPHVLSVGASGAILALAAAALVVTSRLEWSSRSQSRITLVQVLVPSLLPIFFLGQNTHVDYGAHIGGAIVGALCGLVMLRNWRGGARLPGLQQTATMIAGTGGAVALYGAVVVLRHLSGLGLL